MFGFLLWHFKAVVYDSNCNKNMFDLVKRLRFQGTLNAVMNGMLILVILL